MTLPEYFSALFWEKLAASAARRDVFLRALKVRAEEAVATGIVDSAHDNGKETLEAAMQLGGELVGRKWNGEIYGEIRKSLYPDTCKHLGIVAKPVVAPRL